MKYFAGLMAIVLAVAGLTFGGYRAWDKATHTREDNGGVLSVHSSAAKLTKDQVLVTGSVSGAQIDGMTLGPLATPFTVTPTERGVGGATFTPVDVNGKTTSIDWQAGQPLPLSGDGGSLVLGPVACTVADGAVTLVLDGVHAVSPGSYTINTSIAVGSQPRDAVSFTAGDQTTVEFRSGATTPFPGSDVAASGTGTLTLEGALSIEHPDHTTTAAATITLDSGSYQIKLTPTGNGDFTVTALLQGAVR